MGATLAQRERFMALVSGGASTASAAASVGVSASTGKIWRSGCVDFEREERRAQKARAVELARKGLHVDVIAERVSSMGLRVSEKAVRGWVAGVAP